MSREEKQEKVGEVLRLFQKGILAEEVAGAVGYHQKSLSRFMTNQGYKWDREIKNYLVDVDSDVHKENTDDLISENNESKKKEEAGNGLGKEQEEVKQEEEQQGNKQEQQGNNQEDIDVFDLLETEDVVTLLRNSRRIIDLLNVPVSRLPKNGRDESNESNESNERDENIWRLALKYNQANSPSISKSLRIPIELEVEMSNFCNTTGLNQKQVICLGIEKLMEQYGGVNGVAAADAT